MTTLVPLYWGDSPVTWDGEPILVDPDEWDAMVERLTVICHKATRPVTRERPA